MARTVKRQAKAKRKINKGDSLVCEVCGLSVVVEEVSGIAVAEESVLLCCGKPMKEKASKIQGGDMAIHPNIMHSGISFLRSTKTL